jgi:hypothetical protein
VSLPKVTVALGSSRPGGVDVSLAGLAIQDYPGDWEVVFCDWLYHRRHAAVLDAVRDSGLRVPFFHVPNARYSGDRWITICNGYNTSVALADGEIVILLLDYAFAGASWVSDHVAAHLYGGTKKFVMAPHVYRDLPEVVTKSGSAPVVWPMDLTNDRSCTPDRMVAVREDYGDVSVFRQPFRSDSPMPPVQSWRDPKMDLAFGPADPGLFHTKNESFPREAWFAVNGMDEVYDRGRGPGDTDVARRLLRAGYVPWVCPAARVDCLNPRSILPNPNGCVDEVTSVDGRMTYVEGARYCERSDAEGRVVSSNRFTMAGMRALLWPWRELSQEREARIPRVVMTDAEYYQ